MYRADQSGWPYIYTKLPKLILGQTQRPQEAHIQLLFVHKHIKTTLRGLKALLWWSNHLRFTHLLHSIVIQSLLDFVELLVQIPLMLLNERSHIWPCASPILAHASAKLSIVYAVKNFSSTSVKL